MTDGWHGESLLELATAGVDVNEAAQRMLEDGADAETLVKIEEFLRALDADPSARDRALLLIERTGLLAERAAAGAQRSGRLRADAWRTRDDGSALEGVSGVLHHELSTPMMVARLALEQLTDRGDDPTTTEQMVDIALRSLRLAGRLLESLGRAEHLERGWTELSWDQVDLGGLVRECVADVGAVLIAQHGFSVTVEGTVELPADPDAVRQILFNLLTNAAKFSPDGTPIDVTVTTTGEHADVAVRDRGPGIAPQDAARIFDAGQRLGSRAPGMGLGLFIARRIALAHGGELRVEEVPGGSRFVLRLPLSAAEWQRSLSRREDAALARDASQRERLATAKARELELELREEVATQRDVALEEREALARERDSGLDLRDEA